MRPPTESDLGPFIKSPTDADLGAVVKQMIIDGPDQVSPPRNFSVYGFGQIRELIRCMIGYFPDSDTSELLKIPWQPGAPEMDMLPVMHFVKREQYEAAHRTLRFNANLGPLPKPPPDVDLGAVVKQMIIDGPDQVSRPTGLPEYDFDQIRELMRRMIGCFSDCDTSELLKIPWQPGAMEMNGLPMMHFVEKGEYEAAQWTFRFNGEMIL